MVWEVLAAALLSTPEAIRYDRWFSADDMPVEVEMRGRLKRVDIRTIVRPDGTLKACEVISGSGDQKLDLFTCDLVKKRGKYKPAKWIDGSPAFGTDGVPIIWAAGSDPYLPGTDLVIEVNKLPSGVRSPNVVGLMVAVDENGRTLECAPQPSGPTRRVTDHPALVQIACAQILESFNAKALIDDSGNPVRSVQNIRVTFQSAQRR